MTAGHVIVEILTDPKIVVNLWIMALCAGWLLGTSSWTWASLVPGPIRRWWAYRRWLRQKPRMYLFDPAGSDRTVTRTELGVRTNRELVEYARRRYGIEDYLAWATERKQRWLSERIPDDLRQDLEAEGFDLSAFGSKMMPPIGKRPGI
jgi:hypothetical protein